MRYYSKRRKAYFTKQLNAARVKWRLGSGQVYVRSPWGYWVPASSYLEKRREGLLWQGIPCQTISVAAQAVVSLRATA